MLTGAAPVASAQDFGVRVGPRGVEVGPRRRVIEERRIIRERPRRTVCRTEIREQVRPGGVVVRRPVEVCRTRGGY